MGALCAEGIQGIDSIDHEQEVEVKEDPRATQRLLCLVKYKKIQLRSELCVDGYLRSQIFDDMPQNCIIPQEIIALCKQYSAFYMHDAIRPIDAAKFGHYIAYVVSDRTVSRMWKRLHLPEYDHHHNHKNTGIHNTIIHHHHNNKPTSAVSLIEQIHNRDFQKILFFIMYVYCVRELRVRGWDQNYQDLGRLVDEEILSAFLEPFLYWLAKVVKKRGMILLRNLSGIRQIGELMKLYAEQLDDIYNRVRSNRSFGAFLMHLNMDHKNAERWVWQYITDRRSDTNNNNAVILIKPRDVSIIILKCGVMYCACRANNEQKPIPFNAWDEQKLSAYLRPLSQWIIDHKFHGKNGSVRIEAMRIDKRCFIQQIGRWVFQDFIARFKKNLVAVTEIDSIFDVDAL
jgi:hypothetical protein